MSIEAMNWALAQEAGSPSAKCVLLILANRADHDGICWPGFGGISKQTELSRRSVINNIRKLEDAGLLVVEHRPQPLTNIYRLNMSGSAGDALVNDVHSAGGALGSAGDSPQVVQEVHQGSAGGAPEPSLTVSKPKVTVRGTRIPDDFELTEERRLVAEAETLPAERTFAKFVDYWRSASGARARKVDWDATWRNWCRNEVDHHRGATTRKTRFEELMEANDVG